MFDYFMNTIKNDFVLKTQPTEEYKKIFKTKC